jgi:hypothetical protein
MGIIEKSALRRFGCILKLDDFVASRNRHQLKFDAFAFATITAVKYFIEFARGENALINARYIFEKGDRKTI